MIAPEAYYKLARILVSHSCTLHKGDKVLIQASGCDPVFIEVLLEEIYAVGAEAFVRWTDGRIEAALLRGASDAQLKLQGEMEAQVMRQMDAFIGIRGGGNIFESADVETDRREAHSKYVMQPVHFEIRVPKTRWVILRWPTPSMAQQAQMPTQAFTQFFFDACTVDYPAMGRAMLPLQKHMQLADKVHIKGPGATDLRFSISGIPAIPCYGERNIPDGECFTAPIKDSVQGIIEYNTPTIYDGQSFGNVRLRFEKGKIVEATCGAGDNEALQKIFDRDEGARYIGEFAIGVNIQVTRPMRDILFDEKIGGSLHFTPGQAYDIADNGNRSLIHWDLVLIQTPEYGGGEIWFDDTLIRKDGEFVPKDLHPLNLLGL